MNHASAEALLKMRLGVPRSRIITGVGLFLLGTFVMVADQSIHEAQIPMQLEALCMLLAAAAFFAGLHIMSKDHKRETTMKACLTGLEREGLLEKAADALDGEEQGHLGEKCRLAGDFLFAEDMGLVIPAQEIGWMYIRYAGFRRLTLLAETYSDNYGTFLPLVVLPKNAGPAEENELLQTAEALFPEALIGYSKENKAAWKALLQAREEAELAEKEAADRAEREKKAEDPSEE